MNKADKVARDCAVLFDHYRGCSVQELAKQHDISVPSVYKILQTTKANYWKECPERTLKRILQLYVQDYDSAAIGEDVQLREDEIIGFLVMKDLVPNDPGWSNTKDTLLEPADAKFRSKVYDELLEKLAVHGFLTKRDIYVNAYKIMQDSERYTLTLSDINLLKQLISNESPDTGNKPVFEKTSVKTISEYLKHNRRIVGSVDPFVELTLRILFGTDSYAPLRSATILLKLVGDWLISNWSEHNEDIYKLLLAYSMPDYADRYWDGELETPTKVITVGRVCLLLCDKDGYLLR